MSKTFNQLASELHREMVSYYGGETNYTFFCFGHAIEAQNKAMREAVETMTELADTLTTNINQARQGHPEWFDENGMLIDGGIVNRGIAWGKRLLRGANNE